MSVSEVAAVLGVTPTTVLRLIQLKQLPATQALRGRTLDPAQSGRRAMRGRTEPTSDPTNGRFRAIDP